MQDFKKFILKQLNKDYPYLKGLCKENPLLSRLQGLFTYLLSHMMIDLWAILLGSIGSMKLKYQYIFFTSYKKLKVIF